MNAEINQQYQVCDLIGEVAFLACHELAGWKSYGPPRDRMQVAFIPHQGKRYVIVRDDDRAVLVFTPPQWDAFVDGVDKGEFDLDAGIRASTSNEEAATHELAQ